MRILVIPAALAALALALPQPALAQGCGSLASERTRLAAEYQMNQSVIADWKGIARKKRKRQRVERIGRTAAGVAMNVLLPLPLALAANLGTRGVESAITGKPLLKRPRPTSSASVEALRARQSVILARLTRTERLGGCNFYAGRAVGRANRGG